jgi:hypothetical protein
MLLTEDHLARGTVQPLPEPDAALQGAADVREKPGCRRSISPRIVTGRRPGSACSIGTISLSQIPARGSGRRRLRGARLYEGNRGSASTRAPVLKLNPAMAAAVCRVWVRRSFMYNLAC